MMKLLFDDQIACRALQNTVAGTDPLSSQEENSINMLCQHPFFKVWGKGKNQSRQSDFEGTHHAPLSQFFTPRLFEQFQATFETALQQLSSVNDSIIDKKLDMLATLHGLSNLNLEAMSRILGQQWYETYLRYRQQVVETLFPRQLIIVLTYHCNLNCSFCFSKTLQNTEPDYLTEEMLEKILAWMKGKGFKRVCLFGGEPSIHPKFIHILNRFQRSGYEVYFASNGLYSETVAEKLKQTQILKITLNVLAEKTYTSEQRHRLMGNLSKLPSSVELSLRYTLSNNHSDLAFFRELTERYHPGNISVALAFPDKGQQNNFIRTDHIVDYSDKLMEFIEISHIIENQPVIAKPLPYCAFTPEDLYNILFGFKHLSACDMYLDHYLQLTTVNHKGVFYPCHALEKNRKFTIDDNPDLNQLQQHHFETVQTFLKNPVLDKCHECNLYHAQICQGFCFSYFNGESTDC